MGDNSIKRTQPLVSIIINCYNGEKYLRDALESVLGQTYDNWEIIFWDNQSTDLSKNIFISYKDRRFKYHYATKHTILYAARNLAYKECRGEFIAFLDVDDWWSPEKLERQIPLFNNPQVGLVYSNFWRVNELRNFEKIAHNKELPTGWVLDALLKNYNIGMLTVVVRKKALEILDYLFDNDYQVIGDYDLFIRLSFKCKFDCIQGPIAFCRWHGGNMQILQNERHINELQNWLKKMQVYNNIRHNPKLKYVRSMILRLTIQFLIYNDRRLDAISHIKQLKNIKDIIKMIIVLLLPKNILFKIKN